MNGKMEISRRSMLASLASGVPVLSAAAAGSEAPALSRPPTGWIDVKADFSAVGDGKSDDTKALQAAINAGSEQQHPIRLPPGVYSISRPLRIPSNTTLLGSAPSLGFGCRIEPHDCAALIIGGNQTSFHCYIENIMIWPRGRAPDCVISIDNSYSITFRNIRIHEAQNELARAAVVLLGDADIGGHGRCANIIWENLIVRNDGGQPGVAVLAGKGCGSHRFLFPCLENYQVLCDWRGGQIDWVAPYTERAGRYALDCNLENLAEDVHFNSFGGVVDCAKSGLGCAIRSTTRNFNSFGTRWGPNVDLAAYVYALPRESANFYGITPNLGARGNGRYAGVDGWHAFVGFSQRNHRAARTMQLTVPSLGSVDVEMEVEGAIVGEHWARVAMNGDTRSVRLRAFVSTPGRVTIVADNPSKEPVELRGRFSVECGLD